MRPTVAHSVVCLRVCWSRASALQKRMHRSRRRENKRRKRCSNRHTYSVSLFKHSISSRLVTPLSRLEVALSSDRFVITPPPIGRSIVMSVFVCVCVVCLSAIIYSELHVRSSLVFLCMLPMTVVRSTFGGVVTRYVLSVLWMTSCLPISQGCSTSPPS